MSAHTHPVLDPDTANYEKLGFRWDVLSHLPLSDHSVSSPATSSFDAHIDVGPENECERQRGTASDSVVSCAAPCNQWLV